MVVSSNEAVAFLRRMLKDDFPLDAMDLEDLCVNETGFPLGFYHLDSFLSLLQVTLRTTCIDTLRAAYVLIVSYYFLLDDIIDEEEVTKKTTLFLTHLLFGGVTRLATLSTSIGEPTASQIVSVWNSSVSNNARAVLEEIEYRKRPLVPAEGDEFNNIVGRASPFIALYKTVALLGGKKVSPTELSIIEEFVYYMQLGDDLGDWRSDFHKGRWTSFLRQCFSRIGQIPDEVCLERFVYLSGIYEERAKTILLGFERLTRRLGTEFRDHGDQLREFINKQRDRQYAVLRHFVSSKLSSQGLTRHSTGDQSEGLIQH